MIQKTEATVLRIFPFSRTSHIVSWLSRDGDRITTAVKGATRPKSLFLGQYDLFYSCELLYYTRERNGVHIAKECTPLNMRENFRTNWRATQCASWFSALAYNASGAGIANRELYYLFNETLDYISLSEQPPPPIVFGRYEVKILELMGLSPNFSKCEFCTDTQQTASFSFNLASGSRHCKEHSIRNYSEPVISISERAALLYKEAAKSRTLGQHSAIARIDGPHVSALLRFLGLFIRYHIEHIPFEGRACALKALQAGQK
ncbi:MAG: DNA repair protein RecO [Lentisphaerae bacterium]|jgi:DNA repair protein RecO|nr:DNA repair protein RecO [Lentisphaerota bacterium]